MGTSRLRYSVGTNMACMHACNQGLSATVLALLQIALVYPLDTVKVRCQAAGLSSTQVFTNLWKATGGNWAAIAAALYAGALPAVPLAVLVGAVHYVSFGASRRAFAGCSDNSKRKEQPPPGDSLQQQQQQQQSCQHIIVTHGMTGTHFLPMEDPAAVDEPYGEGSQDTANCISSSSSSTSSSSNSGSGSSGSSSSAAAFFPAAAGEAAGEAPLSQEVGEGSMTVNIASAVITAVVTALVEAPLEQFRHNSQAGNIKGNFVREMWRVSNSPAALHVRSVGNSMLCSDYLTVFPSRSTGVKLGWAVMVNGL